MLSCIVPPQGSPQQGCTQEPPEGQYHWLLAKKTSRTQCFSRGKISQVFQAPVHPMWSTAVSSYHVNKCVVVARMLSGRFRCGSLLRHFSPHISGLCELCGEELEDLPHILLPRCPQLRDRSDVLLRFARETLSSSPLACQLFQRITESKDDNKFVQFVLDPSAVPEIITAAQTDPDILPLLFSVTTTWCYSLNRTRTKLLGI